MNKKHFCQLMNNEFTVKHIPNINLWKTFLGHLREFTTISEHYPLRKYHFRSFKTYQDEKNIHTKGKNWFSIHPFSSLQYYRQFCMLFIYVGLVIWDQIDLAYLSKYNSFVTSCDSIKLIMNVIGLIDMILNFITGYILHKEKINVHYHTGYYKTAETATVLDKRKIAGRYLKTFFCIDLFCPLNVIHLLTDIISRNKGVYYVYACVRHVRIFRIYTAERISSLLLTNVRIKQDVMVIVKCLFFYIFFSIFFGTTLIYVPEITSYIYNEDRRAYTHRVQVYYDKAEKSLKSSNIFLHSTFYAFSLMTVYRPRDIDLTVELYMIIILIMIVGIVLKIGVFMSIYSILNRRYRPTVSQIIFMKEVRHYVECLELSKELALDIYRYFNVKMKHEHFQETEILSTLHKKMQYEIFSDSSMGLIRNCHLFRKLPNYFIIQLSLRLKCESYIPGVTVIAAGEIATCMYFIATGTVAVYSGDGTEICHLSDGEYVGEIGILQSTARLADVVTIEHCELYRLDIKDFQEVIKPNSKFYKRIYKIAMKRFSLHVRRETDH